MSLLLLFACLLSGGVLYLQSQADVESSYRHPVRPAGSADAATKIQEIPPFMPVPITSLREITERPLFTEGRLPPEKPADSQQVKAQATPLRLKLEGVAITPESKVAIITDLQNNELLRLSQGMSHGDWKVTDVSEESVTIQQGPRELRLTLEIDDVPGTSGKRSRLPFRLPVPRLPASN
jgi:hypothetical protein